MTGKVLALDLSLNRPGFAVLAVGARGISIAECGHLVVDKRFEHGRRLRQIRDWIRDILERHPDIESPFVKEDAPPDTKGLVLAKTHGVAEEILAEYSFVNYAPTTIKRVVGGHGKAEKADVEAGVRTALGLKLTFQFATDDESDAVAVGLTHLAMAGRLPSGKRYDELRQRAEEVRKDAERRVVAKVRRRERMKKSKGAS